MTTDKIIAGLQLLQPFYAKPDGYNVGTDHDVLYAYATDRPLDEETVRKMVDLGWHQEHDEYDGDEDFAVTDYRPEESWCAYT